MNRKQFDLFSQALAIAATLTEARIVEFSHNADVVSQYVNWKADIEAANNAMQEMALESMKAGTYDVPEEPKAPPCDHPACIYEGEYGCECCDNHFCSDHGSKGGDHETPGYAAVAYPAQCWACGGFNVDEGEDLDQISPGSHLDDFGKDSSGSSVEEVAHA